MFETVHLLKLLLEMEYNSPVIVNNCLYQSPDFSLSVSQGTQSFNLSTCNHFKRRKRRESTTFWQRKLGSQLNSWLSLDVFLQPRTNTSQSHTQQATLLVKWTANGFPQLSQYVASQIYQFIQHCSIIPLQSQTHTCAHAIRLMQRWSSMPSSDLFLFSRKLLEGHFV